MLQKEAVVPEMIDLIKELQSNSLFIEYSLVGGTALALQLGHRTSTDIDLFTPKTQDTVALIGFFRNNYNNINIDIANNTFIRIFVNNIKIEMVWYDEKIIDSPKIEENIKF
ncbi:MAG: nucleotidyl transferase AbiEii/AbiGii toxin family protein [Treponema sp.]|jgi:hypothetical protein|nr:nucleotidyl transferase AbiEii/AbiGii toxin family protein [Treponema sp.]